jgi:hypothetical protein
VNSLIASLPSVLAVTIAFTVFVIARHLWTKDKKQYAAAVVLASAATGLLLAPTWTIATLIAGALVYAASFVRTTRATIATALLGFGAFCVLLFSNY